MSLMQFCFLTWSPVKVVACALQYESTSCAVTAPLIQCCQNVKLQRSIAVEVKSLFSDAGRQHFVDLLREYREGHCKELEQRCPQRKYEPFGFCAAISFPFFWAASFGEFGSPSWRRWGKDLKAAGIRTRCCIFHALDLTHGVMRT
eukprot:jgi/Astpho2/9407/Aster-x0396